MEAILILMSIYAQHERHEDVIELFEALQNKDFDWTALYPYVAEAYAKRKSLTMHTKFT